jgi:hypothetical protein
MSVIACYQQLIEKGSVTGPMARIYMHFLSQSTLKTLLHSFGLSWKESGVEEHDGTERKV